MTCSRTATIFFQALKTSAQNNMQAAPWQVLNEWLTKFDNMNTAENFKKGARTDQIIISTKRLWQPYHKTEDMNPE